MDKDYNKNVPWKKALQDEFHNNVTFGKEAPWEKLLQKARLRDNYTYTVHTTSRQGEEESKDCFYGWGDPRKGEGCIQHTALDGLSFDNAAWISRLLANLGFQVVVTRSDDWTKVVNDANVAMRYDAGHVH